MVREEKEEEEEDILFVIWFYRIEARKIEFLVCRETREEEKETVKTRLSEKGKLVIIDRFASTPRGRDLDTMSIATSVPIWREAAIPPIARKWNDVSKETSNGWIRTRLIPRNRDGGNFPSPTF